MRLHIAAAIVCLATGGCTTYQYAKDVKMVSFDNDVTEGHGVGPIRGESCQELILGIPINDAPSLDAAFTNTRQDAGRLRYLNNVSTERDRVRCRRLREALLGGESDGVQMKLGLSTLVCVAALSSAACAGRHTILAGSPRSR